MNFEKLTLSLDMLIRSVMNASDDNGDGKWVTVEGRHIFIAKGQSLSDAIKSSGKKMPGGKWDKKEDSGGKLERGKDAYSHLMQHDGKMWLSKDGKEMHDATKQGHEGKARELLEKAGEIHPSQTASKDDLNSAMHKRGWSKVTATPGDKKIIAEHPDGVNSKQHSLLQSVAKDAGYDLSERKSSKQDVVKQAAPSEKRESSLKEGSVKDESGENLTNAANAASKIAEKSGLIEDHKKAAALHLKAFNHYIDKRKEATSDEEKIDAQMRVNYHSKKIDVHESFNPDEKSADDKDEKITKDLKDKLPDSDAWYKTLTSEQKDHLGYYSAGSDDVNASLWGRKTLGAGASTEKTIQVIDGIFKTAPKTKEDSYLYRYEHPDFAKEGNVKMDSFVSTTTRPNKFGKYLTDVEEDKDRVLTKILVPKGTPVINMSEGDAAKNLQYSDQGEVLLPRGKTWKVSIVKKDAPELG